MFVFIFKLVATLSLLAFSVAQAQSSVSTDPRTNIQTALAQPDAQPGTHGAGSGKLIPFQKEVNLIGGVSQSGGTGLVAQTRSAFGFVYFRAFTPPKAGHFVLRMLADTLVTGVKSSTQPLLGLETDTNASALLIRFGFSGCYLPTATSMLCMDDGPRITWLQADETSRHVLGSFPLGLSAHLALWESVPLHFRAEFGQWNFKNRSLTNNSFLNLYWLGVGYAW